MIKLLRYGTLVFALLILLPIASCKKGSTKDYGDNDDDGPEVVLLNSGTMGFYPGEVVQIPVQNATLTNQEINTTIEGKPLKIAVVDNLVHFIMPDLTEGTYQVKFTAGKEFQFQVFVRKADVISTPEEYRTVFTRDFDNLMYLYGTRAADVTLSDANRAALNADKQRYKSLFDEYEAAYAKLNGEEKLQFARIVAVNFQWVTNFQQSVNDLKKRAVQSVPKATFAVDLEDYESEQQYAINKWLSSGRVLRDNIAKLSAMILLVPVTGAIPIIGTIGTGIAIGYLITEVAASLSVNLADLSTLMDVTFAPYDDLTLDGAASNIYDSAEDRVISVQARFRTLVSSDMGGSEISGTLKNFLTTLADFRIKVTEVLNKIPARFKPSVVLSALRTNIGTIKRGINGAYLSITNISNSQVKVAFAKLNDGSFKITPTVTGTTDQAVSFDVTYSNPDFSSKLIKKTITTTVKYAIDSTAHYRQLVLGSWSVINLESSETYNLEVQAGGTAKYSVPNKPTTYNATWQIMKVGRKYYFWEDGFWHPGFNQFRVLDKGFADEGLKTPLTGFTHYGDLGSGKGAAAFIKYVKK
jgi:hypothetical protein